MTNSHTHCQVAQGKTQTPTWQRVCLSQRSTDGQSTQETEGQHPTFSGIDETPQNKRPGDGAFCLFRVQRTIYNVAL
jgi:hypothetical protein